MGKREVQKRVKSYLANTLEDTAGKEQYNTEVRKLLSDKTVLAWILKYAVEEFEKYSIAEIYASIEGEPQVAKIPVKGMVKAQAVTGLSTEDNEIGEGSVRYDIRFYVILPGNKRIKLIINIEAQKDYYPGYDLITRGIFYCCRMISSQLIKEFSADNYDDIKKVYSIWICMNAPKYNQNTITRYRIRPQNVFGLFKGRPRYDLISLVMICMGKGKGEQKQHKLIRMLDVLLSMEMQVSEKERILTEEYGMRLTVKMKGVLNQMCNLAEGIEEKAMKRGIKRGMEKYLIQCICKKLRKGKSLEMIAEELEEKLVTVERIYKVAQKYAPEYNEDDILKTLHGRYI